ncbi:MAG: hypothetical protein ACJAYU_005112 [Bradymonadia bacterium]
MLSALALVDVFAFTAGEFDEPKWALAVEPSQKVRATPTGTRIGRALVNVHAIPIAHRETCVASTGVFEASLIHADAVVRTLT